MLILQTEQSFDRQVINGMAIVTRSKITIVGYDECATYWHELGVSILCDGTHTWQYR